MTSLAERAALRSAIAHAARNKAGEVTDHSWQIADAVLPLIEDLVAAKERAEAVCRAVDAFAEGRGPTIDVHRAMQTWRESR